MSSTPRAIIQDSELRCKYECELPGERAYRLGIYGSGWAVRILSLIWYLSQYVFNSLKKYEGKDHSGYIILRGLITSSLKYSAPKLSSIRLTSTPIKEIFFELTLHPFVTETFIALQGSAPKSIIFCSPFSVFPLQMYLSWYTYTNGPVSLWEMETVISDPCVKF